MGSETSNISKSLKRKGPLLYLCLDSFTVGHWSATQEGAFSKIFLPPANEIWDKVMFLHLSVILFILGVVYTPLGRHSPLSRHNPPPPDPPMAAEAGGTHPTGMHSCNNYF